MTDPNDDDVELSDTETHRVLKSIRVLIGVCAALTLLCFVTLMVFGISIRGPIAKLDELTRFNRDVVEAVCDLTQDPTNRTAAQLQRMAVICTRMHERAAQAAGQPSTPNPKQ